MALTLQESGIGASSWNTHLPVTPGLSSESDPLQPIVSHMVKTEVLHNDQGTIGIGLAGEKSYGKKNFMELFSVFISAPLVKVMHGRQEIGEVDKTSFTSGGNGALLILAGRAWKTLFVDWKLRTAHVEPTDEKGLSKWISTGVPLPYDICQSILQVLINDDQPIKLSQRAHDLINAIRDQHDWVESECTLIITTDTSTQWWTFAGQSFNHAAAHELSDLADKVSANNLTVEFTGHDNAEKILAAVSSRVLNTNSSLSIPLDSDFINELKFSECLDRQLQKEILSQRYSVDREQKELANLPVRIITLRC